jgi:hypothetical protein
METAPFKLRHPWRLTKSRALLRLSEVGGMYVCGHTVFMSEDLLALAASRGMGLLAASDTRALTWVAGRTDSVPRRSRSPGAKAIRRRCIRAARSCISNRLQHRVDRGNRRKGFSLARAESQFHLTVLLLPTGARPPIRPLIRLASLCAPRVVGEENSMRSVGRLLVRSCRHYSCFDAPLEEDK